MALLRLTYNSLRKKSKVEAMFKSSELGAELLALKGEISRLLHVPTDEEEHLEQLVAERPIVAIASAFALGIAVGFMLRRH